MACDQRKVQLTAGLWCNVPIHTLYCVNGRLIFAVLQLLYCAIVREYVLYRQYSVAEEVTANSKLMVQYSDTHTVLCKLQML